MNKTKLVLILCALSMAGCAQLQQAKSEKLEDGVHRLSAIGNVFAAKEALHDKLNQRAARLCGGSDKFEYLSEVEIKEFEQEAGIEGASVTGSYQVYSRLVRCTE